MVLGPLQMGPCEVASLLQLGRRAVGSRKGLGTTAPVEGPLLQHLLRGLTICGYVPPRSSPRSGSHSLGHWNSAGGKSQILSHPGVKTKL